MTRDTSPETNSYKHEVAGWQVMLRHVACNLFFPSQCGERPAEGEACELTRGTLVNKQAARAVSRMKHAHAGESKIALSY